MSDTNQQTVNEQWQKKYASNIGEVTILTQPRRVVPGLRWPYEYEAAERKVLALVKDLQDLGPLIKKQFQCFSIDYKMIRYGLRLDVFLLAHAPGLCGDPAVGLDAQTWSSVTSSILARLTKVLGPVSMYVEPWASDKKFQARFETYIKFKERK